MTTIKAGTHGAIRLPRAAARALRMRAGTELEVVQVKDMVLLVPTKSISKNQRYFWTQEWQEKEREADEDIAAGKVLGPFTDVHDAIQALRTAKA